MIDVTFYSDARGVSNTLGYALTFAIIIASVLFIFTSGVGSLNDVRESSQETNSVRAFEIMGNNIEDVHRWQAPSRSTEIQLGGGFMAVSDNDPTRIRINSTNPNTGRSFNHTLTSRTLTFDTGTGTQVVYDTGLLLRADDGNSYPVQDPPFTFTDNRTTYNLIKGRGSSSVGGDITVQLVATKIRSSFVNRSAAPPDSSPIETNITVNASESRLDAWKVYFEQEGLTAVDADVSDGHITYEYTTQRLYVRTITMEYTFSRNADE